MKRSSHVRRRSLGQALVEFALVFPIFFLILTAIFDFGFLHYSRITLSNAVREAAHAAVTQIDNPFGVPAMVRSTVQANSSGLVASTITFHELDGDENQYLWCEPLLSNHATCDFVVGNTKPDPMIGDSVYVRARYPYPSLFVQLFGGTPPTLEAIVQMVIE